MVSVFRERHFSLCFLEDSGQKSSTLFPNHSCCPHPTHCGRQPCTLPPRSPGSHGKSAAERGTRFRGRPRGSEGGLRRAAEREFREAQRPLRVSYGVRVEARGGSSSPRAFPGVLPAPYILQALEAHSVHEREGPQVQDKGVEVRLRQAQGPQCRRIWGLGIFLIIGCRIL